MSDPLQVIGAVLAEKFRVDRLLGEGGHGVVYGGTHLLLHAPIAVKFLKVESTNAEQFLREARILFSLSHPAIVRMYDVGELHRGAMRMPWVVLELLSGPTLEAEIATRRAQRRHFTAMELRALFIPVLEGLAFAQSRGVTHRDIKPANILLSRPSPGREEPKLLDFGTARWAAASFQASAGNTGFTPMYGAPEQWDASIAQPSAATDVYSLALTFLEAATLERAYAGAEDVGALLRAVMSGTGRPDLRRVRPDLPASLHEVLDRAMAIYPTSRYRDAGELCAAVEQALLTTTVPNGSPIAASLPLGASGPPLAYASAPPLGQAATPPPTYGTSAPPAGYAPTQTTSPLMQSQGKPVVAKTSTGAVILMVVGILATIFLVVGAVIVVGVSAAIDAISGSDALKKPLITVTPPAPHDEDDDSDDDDKPSSGTTPATSAMSSSSAAPPRAEDAAPPHLSKGLVEVNDRLDMADAARVMKAHHPEMDRCFQDSQKWTGDLVITVKVRSRDGHAVGSTCKTTWHEDAEKRKRLPKLDPRAMEFCSCTQTLTPTWTFAKGKEDQFSQPFPDFTNDLAVDYTAE